MFWLRFLIIRSFLNCIQWRGQTRHRPFFTLFTRLLSRFLMERWPPTHTLLTWSAHVCSVRRRFPLAFFKRRFLLEWFCFDELAIDWVVNADVWGETAQRPRQVGVCMKHLPHDEEAMFNSTNVPWQRVINSKGAVSPRWATFYRRFSVFILCAWLQLRMHINATLVCEVTNSRTYF